jgi:ferredoxin
MRGPYVITEPCLYVCTDPRIPRDEMKHLICVDVCPMNGIRYEPGKDRMLYIDPEECISCGACFFECPVEAIYPVEDLPEEWAEYVKLNAEWFYGDKDAVRKRIEDIAPK